MHRILIDKNLCEGCKTCVLACMMRNTKAENLYTIDLNSIDTESKNHIEMDINNHPVPIFCRHCDEPECVITCMSGAMSKDEETPRCVKMCPTGAIKIQKEDVYAR